MALKGGLILGPLSVLMALIAGVTTLVAAAILTPRCGATGTVRRPMALAALQSWWPRLLLVIGWVILAILAWPGDGENRKDDRAARRGSGRKVRHE